MNDLNVITVIGRLGRDAESKYLPDGTAVLNCSIAVNRREKKDGQWQDVADWWKVSMFGKRAESVVKYLVKGKQIAVTGTTALEKKDDKLYPSIRANDIQLLGDKGDGHPDYTPPPSGKPEASERAPGKARPPVQGDFTDDIPF